jgi:glycosyltransferase involved in cell wall biosynthesis
MQKICIIVPCYNEALRLRTEEFVSFAQAADRLFLYFVNDGSTDDTAAVVDRIVARVPGRAFHLDLKANYGKAEAVRQGMIHAAQQTSAEFFGFWDADLSTPLSEICHLSQAFSRNPSTIAVFGSRVKRLGTDIVRDVWRHYLGRVFATAASLAVGLPVYDSQCGAKIFRWVYVEPLFQERFVTNWLFDVEILARMRRLYGVERTTQSVYETPLYEWKEVRGSKVRLGHFLTAPIDLFRIHRRYRRAAR